MGLFRAQPQDPKLSPMSPVRSVTYVFGTDRDCETDWLGRQDSKPFGLHPRKIIGFLDILGEVWLPTCTTSVYYTAAKGELRRWPTYGISSSAGKAGTSS